MRTIGLDKHYLSGRGSPARRGPGAAEPRPARPTSDPIEVLAPNEDPDCDHPCPTSRGRARVVTGDCWISSDRSMKTTGRGERPPRRSSTDISDLVEVVAAVIGFPTARRCRTRSESEDVGPGSGLHGTWKSSNGVCGKLVVNGVGKWYRMVPCHSIAHVSLIHCCRSYSPSFLRSCLWDREA